MPTLDAFGMVVADMAATLRFYRLIGLDIPSTADDEQHVEVELASGAPCRTAMIVADVGRSGLDATARQLLDDGYRVVALDPFYIGESKITSRDFLFALLVASVGQRPLGLQAGQLSAAARWLVAARLLRRPRNAGPRRRRSGDRLR